MKTNKLKLAALLFTSLLTAWTGRGAIIVPHADGSDDALNITADTVIDLSKAVTGKWDDKNSANAGAGVYDPEKWAVVFKYTDVNVAAGATVRFKNHASRAPVVWLVSGDVKIDGAVSLNGAGADKPTFSPLLSEPGPGGFRGGAAKYTTLKSGSGFGPGGGAHFDDYDGVTYFGAGSYGSAGQRGSAPYGNPSLIPLIGGSGGAGHHGDPNLSGGAGGGALLIAAAGNIIVNGFLTADGGTADDNGFFASGSGGGIRLVSSEVGGHGIVRAVGGYNPARPGGLGRIRIERVISTVDPATPLSGIPGPSVIDLSEGSTALLWPPTGAPEVRIVSIGAVNTPPDPRAEFGTIGADVVLPIVSSTQVIVETTNVEEKSTVSVRVTPRSNGNFVEALAAKDESFASADPAVLHWKADLPVNVGYSAVQVKVVRP